MLVTRNFKRHVSDVIFFIVNLESHSMEIYRKQKTSITLEAHGK